MSITTCAHVQLLDRDASNAYTNKTNKSLSSLLKTHLALCLCVSILLAVEGIQVESRSEGKHIICQAREPLASDLFGSEMGINQCKP